MSKKISAVEWLGFEINRRGPKEDNPPQWLKELYNQAKAMEKEQLSDAWYAGDEDGPIHDFEIYYQKTYN